MSEYFYDYHLTREDLLTGWNYPAHGLYALLDQLEWLYQSQGEGEKAFIAHKLNFYLSDDPTEEPLSPELAVFKGLDLRVEARLELRSWPIPEGKSPPEVAFEFTAHPRWQWEKTLKLKPALYGLLGVKELFVYDGLESWPKDFPRLVGWRYEAGDKEMKLLQPNQAGWLWSEELASWLEAEGSFLLLRDRAGKVRQSAFQVREAARGRHWLLNGYLLREEEDVPEEHDFQVDTNPQTSTVPLEKMLKLARFLIAQPAFSSDTTEDNQDDEDNEEEEEDGLDEGLEPAYYFDRHPTREDVMGRTPAQSEATSKLMAALAGLVEAEGWFVASNFAIYHTTNPKEYPLEPDAVVFKGVSWREIWQKNLRSWKLALPDRPVPGVVFEVSQHRNWYGDLYEKPRLYQLAGVREYFAFDPHRPLCWDRALALVGWRYYPDNSPEEISSNEQGWLWSEELASWIAAEKSQLRFYDAAGQPRPTKPDWYLM
jgi:Uma2 family endonuclease